MTNFVIELCKKTNHKTLAARPWALGFLLVAVLLPVAASAQIVLYRVNCGGGALTSLDAGIGWDADTTAVPSSYFTAGSNTTFASSGGSLDGSVPVSTPAAIFDSERYDQPTAPEMAWDFPLGDSGGTVEVRLYFMNSYSGTSNPGDRSFDVLIEGVAVLTGYDMVADVGHNVGVMKSFTVASDANLDIDCTHGVENPLINAIEILGDPAVANENSSWGELKSLFR